MKKFVLFVCCFIVVPLTAGELTFDVSMPSIKSQKTRDAGREASGYAQISVPKYSIFPTSGLPSVPYKVVRVLIPPTASVAELMVEKKDSAISRLSSPLLPVQEPVPISRIDEAEFTEPNEEIYSSNKPFPGYISEDLGVGEMSGFRIAQIALYPVQYIPAENKLISYSLNVRLRYKERKVKAKKMTEKQYEIFKRMVEDLVDNPEAVDAYQSVIRR
jgi:hypothetical protein